MLIDTNIFLEIALDQEKQKTCRDLMKAIDDRLFNENIYITRFSLSAIEAMIKKDGENFIKKVLLLIVEEKILVAPWDISDDLMINSIRKELNLDFDDTTQFVAANKLGTYLVTFDKDFKKTGLEIKTPKEVLKTILR